MQLHLLLRYNNREKYVHGRMEVYIRYADSIAIEYHLTATNKQKKKCDIFFSAFLKGQSKSVSKD